MAQDSDPRGGFDPLAENGTPAENEYSAEGLPKVTLSAEGEPSQEGHILGRCLAAGGDLTEEEQSTLRLQAIALGEAIAHKDMQTFTELLPECRHACDSVMAEQSEMIALFVHVASGNSAEREAEIFHDLRMSATLPRNMNKE